MATSLRNEVHEDNGKKEILQEFFCFSEVELIPRKWYTYTSIFQMY